MSLPTEQALPLVVIAGRPNVGKSTLFNRLVRRRQAITDALPGVTRDHVQADCVLAGRRVRLVDTGGLGAGDPRFAGAVAEASLAAARRADLVILVMDVTETNAEDDDAVALMRPLAGKVVLAVNKVDNPERENETWNFHRFGFESVVGVSAAHGRNIDALAETARGLLDGLSPEAQEAPAGEEPAAEEPGGALTLAVIGKPNTGKSTLVNRLSGSELALVSDVPGTTRDVLEGRFMYARRVVRILDTAGIRRKAKVNDDVEYYSVNRAIKTLEEADVSVLLVDARQGLSDQDKKIAYQAVKKGRAIVLALNKWDLMPQGQARFEAVRERIRFQFPVLDFAPVVAISAQTGFNLRPLLDLCLRIEGQSRTRIETNRLNQALARWTEETPPPREGGLQYKVRFMTQVGVQPPRFILFVNRSRGFPQSYVGYLRNRIRSDFALPDIPLQVFPRAGKRG